MRGLFWYVYYSTSVNNLHKVNIEHICTNFSFSFLFPLLFLYIFPRHGYPIKHFTGPINKHLNTNLTRSILPGSHLWAAASTSPCWRPWPPLTWVETSSRPFLRPAFRGNLFCLHQFIIWILIGYLFFNLLVPAILICVL